MKALRIFYIFCVCVAFETEVKFKSDVQADDNNMEDCRENEFWSCQKILLKNLAHQDRGEKDVQFAEDKIAKDDYDREFI